MGIIDDKDRALKEVLDFLIKFEEKWGKGIEIYYGWVEGDGLRVVIDRGEIQRHLSKRLDEIRGR